MNILVIVSHFEQFITSDTFVKITLLLFCLFYVSVVRGIIESPVQKNPITSDRFWKRPLLFLLAVVIICISTLLPSLLKEHVGFEAFMILQTCGALVGICGVLLLLSALFVAEEDIF